MGRRRSGTRRTRLVVSEAPILGRVETCPQPRPTLPPQAVAGNTATGNAAFRFQATDPVGPLALGRSQNRTRRPKFVLETVEGSLKEVPRSGRHHESQADLHDEPEGTPWLRDAEAVTHLGYDPDHRVVI